MKVCILGNNLSGLTLAKSFVNQNIYVDLLMQKKDIKISQSRTLGISKSNIDYFNNHIINIEKLLWKLKKIEIFSDKNKNKELLNFRDANEELFSIIKNEELSKLLEKNLLKNKFFKKKLFNSKRLSFVKEYDLVINCDYSHAINKKYFSKKIIKNYESFAYTTIITHEKILNDVAIQIFTKMGPLAFLPISNNQTSIVFSVYNFGIVNENIEEFIRIYGYKYKIKKINKIEKFKLKSSHLRSYYYKNILAFGDLLHKIHPLAGQGFNMTIRDIKILNNIIKNRHELGLPLDESVNYEFENSLKHKNFIFSNGIDLIHEIFKLERKTGSNILSKSIQTIASNPSVNKMFTKIADKGILL